MNDQKLITRLTDYFRSKKKNSTYIISLVGGPASGKGTLVVALAQALGKTAYLSTDNYLKGDRKYRRENIENLGLDPIKKYDFDFLKQQIQAIKWLKEGEKVGVPIYDGQTGIAISIDPSNMPNPNTYATKINKVDYLIVEGDFQPLDRNEIDTLVYLDVSDNIRLDNRVYRDLQTRGESAQASIIDNFNSRQKTQFIPHTLPNKEVADVVIKVEAKKLEKPTPARKFEYIYNILIK